MTTKTDKPAAQRPRKMARETKPHLVEAPQGSGETPTELTTTAAAPAPSTAKTSAVLGLLTRPEGATLEQMVAATGWLPHTTRAALTGLKKKGHELTSIKADGVRTYRVTPVQREAATLADQVGREPAA